MTTPFVSGNATYLRTDGEVVIAAFDFDPDEEESESIGIDVFMELLNEWRLQVIAHGGVSGSEAPRLPSSLYLLRHVHRALRPNC